jgi:hypothetical protein
MDKIDDLLTSIPSGLLVAFGYSSNGVFLLFKGHTDRFFRHHGDAGYGGFVLWFESKLIEVPAKETRWAITPEIL